MEIKFKALDYNANDTFEESEYEYVGNTRDGWTIKRNGKIYLELGPGYRLLKTKTCGICSTDLSRRFLPFQLPQIIGHEVVACDVESQQDCVVEINDSHAARGSENPDVFCRHGLPTHCPGRMVLGIDRLPGGFGPYILAPSHAIIPIGSLSAKAAVMLEPFAAALHAITSSPPLNEDRVAVLGTGRLGLLLLAALKAYRGGTQETFKVTAFDRYEYLCDLAHKMGADEFLNIENTPPVSLKGEYDLVYDATGSPAGLETALLLAGREVHLKSTSGRETFGFKHITELVVDELSILPFSETSLMFHWRDDERTNQWIYLSSGAESLKIPQLYHTFSGSYPAAEEHLRSDSFDGRIPRFDIGIAASVSEIDDIIRPDPEHENSIISYKELTRAFETARESGSVKVVISHE
jgi:threonine dehydrogenase-like Zn-dependent dehydrogenase